MYLNVTINDRVNLNISTISEAYLRQMQKQIVDAVKSVDIVEEELQELVWENEAAVMTSESWANETIYEPAKVYTSNGDGTFTATDQNSYSAKGYMFIAMDRANEIKQVGVFDPVESIPNEPGGLPGTPTVYYDPATGLFHFGIPNGEKGEQGIAGTGIIPQGNATVAEINALLADPVVGASWMMDDAGLITYGSIDVTVAINEWISWAEDGYFINIGIIQGEDGDPGTPGADGADGNDGATGATGTAATADAGTTTTGAEGTDAEVTNSGTTAAAIFDFIIPAGATGATGSDGDDGQPGTGLYPQGDATVAEINAFVSDPSVGSMWMMLDAGTITYGITPVDVVIDDWAVWAAEGSFVNIGPIAGPKGDDGLAATVDAGTTTTLAPGTLAYVVNAGSASAAEFNFGIPEGVPGADGTIGQDGADGPAGPTVVSTDVGNTAVLGVDMFLFVPMPTASQTGAAATVHDHTVDDITDFPATMPPDAHTHPTSEVVDLDAALAGKLAIDATAADSTKWAGATKFVIADGDTEPVPLADGDVLFIYTPVAP